MSEVAQVLGAVLILVPFAWSQLGSLRTDSGGYLLLNFVGSGVLAALALDNGQWGFLLLEGVWSLVAAWSLARLAVRAAANGA
jgi:hypothetical protein